jgi:HSP20 family protein
MDHLPGGTHGPIRSEYPFLQAWSADEGFILVANMPGVDEDDLEITADGRMLTFTGRRAARHQQDSTRTHRQERASGQFSKSIDLAFDVEVKSVKAVCADGLLQIELPRPPEERPRKITIEGS